MLNSLRLTLVAGVLTLTGCGPTPEQIAAATFSLAETQTPLQMFSDVCLADLPKLESGARLVSQMGLQLAQDDDGLKFYRSTSGKTLAVVSADEFEGIPVKVCGVAFLGSPDNQAVSELFLDETTRRTGGNPRKKYPSSFFEYAYHLGNGSVATHDARKNSGQNRHIFLVTQPVTESEVSKLIYN